MSITRRRFLTQSGVVLWLPILESLVPSQVFAQAQGRSKFIGVFTPSGMHMQHVNGVTNNGNWTFENALKPVVDQGHKNNLMILRGIHSTYGQDPHWQNTAGFLSCVPLTLGANRPVICGKSFDQFVADKHPTPMRSLHLGWKQMNRDFSGDHALYSDRYVDTIAWRDSNRPISNTNSVSQVYDAIFTANAKGSAHLKAAHSRRRSLLDFVLSDLKNVQRDLTKDDRERLQAYTEGVRELEVSVSKLAKGDGSNACESPSNAGNQGDYAAHVKWLQSYAVQALACDLVSSVTIMYDDGVGDAHLLHPGTSYDHHGYAHLVDGNNSIAGLESINRRHATFFADLITLLKGRGQLDKTLAVWGSNMSDGTVHSTDNLPFVIAGAGSDLKFGQEVGTPGDRVAKADVFVEMAKLYGMSNITSFGSDVLQSTGKLRGIKA